MDFLIMFLVLLVPNLPDDQIQSFQMGPMAAKIILLIFGYELILTEIRGKTHWLWAATLFSMAVVTAKGILGTTSIPFSNPIPITFGGFVVFLGFLLALRLSRRPKIKTAEELDKIKISIAQSNLHTDHPCKPEEAPIKNVINN